MTMALHVLADDLSPKDIERGEQRGCAMTLVIVGHGTIDHLLEALKARIRSVIRDA
jgi:hypothetical protein